ncbi:NRDE-2, necessary for RNA interference-domain-containing protein [Cadophora sp. MPI-SDFR-AT-0126]|nr:NRDE-2, necessary for RNA interference-domain-containing protein [Leotiomycetes sp. MPI-SDFR-AT-0126]
MSVTRTSIPKFGSFKPKPAVPTPEPEKPKTESRTAGKHRHRGSDEREDKRRNHKRPRSNSRERLPTKLGEEPTRASNETKSPDIFIIDRKGDVKNIIYGSIHRYSVPPFYRYGSGYVLGASSDVKIDRSQGDDKAVVLRNWRMPRSREKYVFSKVEKERPRLLRIRPEVLVETSGDIDLNFVPLQVPRGKKRNCGTGNESSDDEEKRDYRSIYGKPKGSGQPADEDLQYATETDSSGSDTGRVIRLDSAIRQKNVELSRKVEEFPQDITAWLALIDHQDVLMKAGDDQRRTTSAEIKSTAEIKIHMHEKALEKVQSLEDRERLLLGLMAEGTKIWELKVQTDRWEKISQDNIDSLLLWKSYLNFKQSTFTTFRYEDIRDVYLKRIRLLQRSLENASEEVHVDIYEQLIYVMLRLTLFIREAGYTELAVSIWQGLLEINFNAPSESLAQATLMDSFKDFWESEVSRIGESGSLGWRHFAANSSDSDVPDTQTDEVDDSLNHSDIFRTWAAAERIRMKCSRSPARTMDEVVEDDPYRVIMFSDIEDFLIQLPPSSEILHKSCIEAFILFCRLPPLATAASKFSWMWASDPFVRNELLECNSSWIKTGYFPQSNSDEDLGKSTLLHNPFPNCISTPDVLFGQTLAGNDYFGSPPSHQSPFSSRFSGDNGPVSITWVRNTLAQLVQASFTEDLAEYYLAFEYHHSPSTIKKVAKGLLKQHPSNLRLYNAYAMIEWSRGNKDIANGVFSAALNMNSTNSPQNRGTEHEQPNDAILLWMNWAWLHLGVPDHKSAIQTLLSIVDGKPDPSINLSPTILLRAKQHLSSTRDFLCSAGDYGHAVLYTECLALLIYLTSPPTSEPQSPTQGSILPTLEIYTTFTSTLLSRSNLPPHSNPNTKTQTQTQIHLHILTLHQSLARLLIHHISLGPYRPTLLKSTILPLLTHLPHPHLSLKLTSTPLLHLLTYLQTPGTQHLSTPTSIRTLLQSTLLSPPHDSLSTRLFAIQYELRYGTRYSVATAFESAVSSSTSVGRASAGLWKLYFLFCLYGFGEGDGDGKDVHSGTGPLKGSVKKKAKATASSKAKDVWFRALRACPWAKELYVLGMEELGAGYADGKSGVTYEELRGTWRVMGEKECRVHVDLEDAFEEIGEFARDAKQRRVAYK